MTDGLVRVLPDTNVCYPISLLDLVLRCDEYDLHRVVWTDDLLDELVRTLMTTCTLRLLSRLRPRSF